MYDEDKQIEYNSQVEEFSKAFRIAFNTPELPIKNAGSHISKSFSLPILSCEHDNIFVKNISYNWYFVYLSAAFKKPLDFVFLFPLSAMFHQYALSGHTDRTPPVLNFEKSFHNRSTVSQFGIDAGSLTSATIALRYLHEISRLDPAPVYDAAYPRSTEFVDSNNIDFGSLCSTFGIQRAGKFDPYEFEVLVPESSIFSRIVIDWYDSKLSHNLVHVYLKDPKNYPLPYFLFSWLDIFVDSKFTALAPFLPEAEREYDRFLPFVPINLLPRYPHEEPENILSYKRHFAYHRVSWDIDKFTFKTQNAVFAASLALFLLSAVSPVATAFREFEPRSPQ